MNQLSLRYTNRRRPSYVRLSCMAIVIGLAACSAPRSRPESTPTAVIRRVSDPASVVKAQAEAYNRRDLNDFMAFFAPEIRLYAFPDSLLYAGKDTLRALYGGLFSTASALRADVTDRLTQGRFVVDREIVSGMPGRPPVTGLVIYEVRDGHIVRMWLVD